MLIHSQVQNCELYAFGRIGNESMGLRFEWGEVGDGPEFGIWFNSFQECNTTRTLNSEVSWAGVRVQTLWVFLINDISVLLGNFPQTIALSVEIL